MTQAAETGAKTPWHVWTVGILGVLWNGYGAYDYTMSQMQGDAYLRASGMSEAQVAYFHGLPAWMTVAWAIGVWGGVLGSVLLLARSRFALHAYVASLCGLVASLIHTYLISDAARGAGAQTPVLSGVLLVACLFFVWYAAKVTKQGVLR